MSEPQRRLPVQAQAYNEDAAAAYMGCEVDELRKLRELGNGPMFIYLPATGEYEYTPEALNTWLSAKKHGGGNA